MAKGMNIRRLILWTGLGLVGLLLLAGIAGYLLMGSFEATEFWADLRRNNLELATQVKTVIAQADQDVALIGEKRQLPLIALELSRKDIAHFADLYDKYEDPQYGIPYYAQHNVWRKAKLTYDGRRYDVKIKSHGRSPTNHRSGKYISLTVKLPRGEQIHNSRRFSLLVREHFVSKKQVVFDVAEHFGVLTNREQLVRVKINHWEEKLYFFDRRLNDAFMEADGRPSLRIFGYSFSQESTNKSSVFTDGSFNEIKFRTRFKQTLTELEYPETQHAPLTNRFVDFNRMLAEQRYEDLTEFCDLDYISSFQAVRLITCLIGHLARYDNLYVFYDTANGKFYPVITRDSWMERMELVPNGSPELYVDTAGPWEQPLFHAMSRNLDVRRAAYRKIYQFIQEQGSTVDERHRLIKERFEKLSYFGWATVGMRNAGWMNDDFTTHNLKVLQHFIETATPRVRVSVAKSKVVVSLVPSSLAGCRIRRFTVPANRKLPRTDVPVKVWGETSGTDATEPIYLRRTSVPTANGRIDLTPAVNQLEFITPLSADTQRVEQQHAVVIELDSESVQTASGPIEFVLQNSVTGQDLTEVASEAQFREFDAAQFAQIAAPPADRSWLAHHPQLKVHVDDDQLVIEPGEYRLTHDLILPKHLKLIIEAGTTLRLAGDVAIGGFRGMEVRGTEQQPVRITALDPARPFGSVGILGGNDSTSTLRHLSVSGGNERWVDGVYFSGALSIHDNTHVRLDHCSFMNNHADDGLNIKYGDVAISDCLFRDNAADQVDLDLCTGFVKNCQFLIDERQDTNGDGLDVSGAELTIEDSSFRGFADKGLSIGEQSRILCQHNRFVGNTVGAAVKDASHAFFANNEFRANRVDFDAYQKKSIYSGGNIWFDAAPDPSTSIFLDAKSKAYAASHAVAFANQSKQETPVSDPVAEHWTSVNATLQGKPVWRIAAEEPTNVNQANDEDAAL